MQVNINTSTKAALLFCGALMSSSAFAENVIPKGASNLPSLEFGALVKTYMIDSTSKSSWNFSTNSQNILWDSGVTWKNDTRKYEKDGFVRLQFDGFKLKEDTYNNPKKVRPEAAWNINYSGKNKSDVSQITIEHFLGGFLSDTDEIEIPAIQSLTKYNINYQPVCIYKLGFGNYSTAYKLSTLKKKDIYLLSTIATGVSGNLSISYNLFPNKKDFLDYFYDFTDTDEDSSNCISF
ncbi:hypothetical protein [Psychrobacter ciconiae]|uniref:hypothetical protein n=1 Tax=Psychrobacter ciconiae TaxID=1553449 RepID=UPI001D0FB51F|nr:hypothetical protein [Psychrobacter ciconiae]